IDVTPSQPLLVDKGAVRAALHDGRDAGMTSTHHRQARGHCLNESARDALFPTANTHAGQGEHVCMSVVLDQAFARVVDVPGEYHDVAHPIPSDDILDSPAQWTVSDEHKFERHIDTLSYVRQGCDESVLALHRCQSTDT